MTLLKSLPSGYRFTQKEIQNQGTLVQVHIRYIWNRLRWRRAYLSVNIWTKI